MFWYNDSYQETIVPLPLSSSHPSHQPGIRDASIGAIRFPNSHENLRFIHQPPTCRSTPAGLTVNHQLLTGNRLPIRFPTLAENLPLIPQITCFPLHSSRSSCQPSTGNRLPHSFSRARAKSTLYSLTPCFPQHSDRPPVTRRRSAAWGGVEAELNLTRLAMTPCLPGRAAYCPWIVKDKEKIRVQPPNPRLPRSIVPCPDTMKVTCISCLSAYIMIVNNCTNLVTADPEACDRRRFCGNVVAGGNAVASQKDRTCGSAEGEAQ
jgi:hypothetical protein